MSDVLFITLLIWQVFGFIFCLVWSIESYADGWELCNPYWAYKYHRSVNWFGAIVLSLVYTALFPIGAIIYWFYKLCTVGRK